MSESHDGHCRRMSGRWTVEGLCGTSSGSSYNSTWVPCQTLSDDLHMEADVHQCIMVQDETAVKDEGRLQHIVVDTLVVQVLGDNKVS